MDAEKTHVFLPGEDVTEEIARFTSTDLATKFVVGPGLVRKEKTVIATVAGHLMSRKDPLVFWIHANQRRVGNLVFISGINLLTNDRPNSTYRLMAREWLVW